MLSLAAIRLRITARQAARNRDWTAASKAYRAYLDRRPGDAKGWVQYGHVAKESGDLEIAADAYGRALDAAPQAAEIWWHLSHACKGLGDRAAAIDCCTRAALLDPGFTNATEELVALGARDRIPVPDDSLMPDEKPADEKEIGSFFGFSVYAPSRYDAFRQKLAIVAPPVGLLTTGHITIVIDAITAIPTKVRATLSSLLDQVDTRWTAIVYAPAAIRDHSVASLATIDSRIRFTAIDTPLPSAYDAPKVLLIGAGTMLDRQAVAWFSFAAARTDCVAAYCDHDQSVDDWRTGRVFMRPVFHTMFDPVWNPALGDGPAVIFVDQTRLPLIGWRQDDAWRVVGDAASVGSVGHLPLLLASRKILPLQAEQAPPDPVQAASMTATPAASASHVDKKDDHALQRIQVVIQTRDEPAMLRAAVESIRKCAAHPDLLDIMIVDNRSIEPVTARLLDRFRRRNIASVMTLDEPFNWSRANNLAVEAGTAPLILFLNNDTEMLTPYWDDILRSMLSASGVGAVGAMLLYPDRTIQHAGIVMGMGSGGPIHEGVGRLIDDGPGDRWRKTRSAAAVTGAFLAIRRDTFKVVEGFDAARFAIAFNDIDLCLRVRAVGLHVVMASEIQVIHHESKTRGMNITRSQVAWDLDELGRLHDRWGAAMFQDPAYNPYWTRTGQPFDGYRFPSIFETVRHLDLSARRAPWTPTVKGDEPAWW